jgi:undecaprenyl-diphosphatase
MALRARTAPRRRRGRLGVGQALALGLIQGPAELLPVSSSGHLVLIPALLGWPYARLDAELRKTFEVALHTGAGLALLWVMRREVAADLRDPGGTALLAAPAALAGSALEPLIEERLSDPRLAAAAQIAGGAALIAVDVPTTSTKGARPNWARLLVVAVAQALALVPGVSRNGATMTAARALGLSREDALRLSWRAGLPVIGGATVLKGAHVAQRGLDRDLRVPFAVGAAAAFASTLAAAPLLRLTRRSWAPLGAYRVALGALALRRLHRLQWPSD